VRAYLSGCSTFITTPRDQGQFFNFARALRTYWFEVATLPGAMVEP
jgi:hypothetical protein